MPINATTITETPTLVSGDIISGTIVGRFLLGLIAFSGAFVLFEPAPYELLLCLVQVVFLVCGLALGRNSLVLLVLFSAFTFGGFISMQMMPDPKGITVYLLVTLFLGISAAFWCAVISRDVAILRTMMRMMAIGGAISSVLGVIGYFGVHSSFEIFTLYDRAKGAFQDPNVLGAFIILPMLYLIYGILERRDHLLIFRLGLLLMMMAGLFLAFSRGAWGTFFVAGCIFFVLLVLSAPSFNRRLQLLAMAAFGVMMIVALLLVALQFEAVSEMFSERAKLLQSYDADRGGRFGRHAVGFLLAMENPLGIGPLQFGFNQGEDTHNIWLKSLLAYGWLGFTTWLTVTVLTLVGGMKILLRPRPWRPYLQLAWAVFVAHNVLAIVIDVDHWRHYYLLIGIIWGCMALEARVSRQVNASPAIAT